MSKDYSYRGEMQFVIIYYLASRHGEEQGTVSSVLAYFLALYSRMRGDMDKKSKIYSTMRA
jgi:hypothetical protein